MSGPLIQLIYQVCSNSGTIDSKHISWSRTDYATNYTMQTFTFGLSARKYKHLTYTILIEIFKILFWESYLVISLSLIILKVNIELHFVYGITNY